MTDDEAFKALIKLNNDLVKRERFRKFLEYLKTNLIAILALIVAILK